MRFFFAILKVFSSMRSHLLIAGLSACAIGVLLRKSSCVNEIKLIYLPILFFQIQNTWSHAEVQDPFETEFCKGGWTGLCNICWGCCVFSTEHFCLIKRQVSIGMWTCLDLFYWTRICFYANIMLFYYYTSVAQLEIMWWVIQIEVFFNFQEHFSYSKFFFSIWSRKMSLQLLWRLVFKFCEDCIESVDYCGMLVFTILVLLIHEYRELSMFWWIFFNILKVFNHRSLSFH